MKFVSFPPRSQWDSLILRPAHDFGKITDIIAPIIRKVKEKGDKGLRKLNLEYDHVNLENLLVSREEFEEAEAMIDKDLKEAIQIAQSNIEKFHKIQIPGDLEISPMPGVHCMRKAVPIEKVGFYIPGGTAPLFSTVLMLGIPARLAGCEKIVICSPCNIQGKIHPAILYSARLLGIETVVKAGGAQAIAALAFGTESVPQVDKIFGPGNQYVTMAKLLVSHSGVAIDMPAGPSELAIVADHTANPAFMASDLLSQAEHGTDSEVILVSPSPEMLRSIEKEIKKQILKLSRNQIIEKSLNHSLFILVHSVDEALDFINHYAPEHLILSVENPQAASKKIKNAGSVFLGNYSPEAAGDYASGTNHTLPTNGNARAYSGISVESFMKLITFQHITPEGLEKLGKTIETMAGAEQLMAHKNAVKIRLKKTGHD